MKTASSYLKKKRNVKIHFVMKTVSTGPLEEAENGN
jgi:hypothetical protein